MWGYHWQKSKVVFGRNRGVAGRKMTIRLVGFGGSGCSGLGFRDLGL